MRYNSTHSRTVGPDNTTILVPYVKKVCFQENDTHTKPLFLITQIIVPILMAVGLIGNFLTYIVMRRLGHSFLPLCIYLSYIAVFDTIDLCLRGTDLLVEAFTRTRLVSAIQLLNQPACQIFPVVYNVFKQAQGALYIGMAIDTWRFVCEPIRMFGVYRSEWIRNVLILACAVLLTINGQFFWTFDITISDAKILRGHIIKRSLDCGFSTTWPLNHVFIEYIWPIMDHLAGDILPFILTGVFGTLAAFKLRGQQPDPDQLFRFLINSNFVLQVRRVLTGIVLMYSLFAAPTVFYIMSKYCMFSSTTKKRFTFVMRHATGNAKDNHRSTVDWAKILRIYETWYEHFEFGIKHFMFLFMILKFLILVTCIPQFRELCSKYLKLSCRKKTNRRQSVSFHE